MNQLTKRQITIACILAQQCGLAWFGASAQLGEDALDPVKLNEWAKDFDEIERPWCSQQGELTIIGSQVPDELHFIVEPDGTAEMYFERERVRVVGSKVLPSGTAVVYLHEDTWNRLTSKQLQQLRQATDLAAIGQQPVVDEQWVDRTLQATAATFKRLSTLIFGGDSPLPDYWGIVTAEDSVVSVVNSSISLVVSSYSAAKYAAKLLNMFPDEGLRALF